MKILNLKKKIEILTNVWNFEILFKILNFKFFLLLI